MSAIAEPFLSVTIPAYNEQKRLAETLSRIKAYLSHKSYAWEIVVCSDGSKDRTDQVVLDWIRDEKENERVRLLRSDHNIGKGATVRRAILDSKGQFVLITDVDLSSPIKEVDKLLAALEKGADVAIGSRALRSPGADVQQSPKRWFSGRVFNFFVRQLVLKGFHDTQCGFKAFKRRAAFDLFTAQTLQGFSFDVEILLLAVKRGYKVTEVPVMWKEANESKVSLVRDSIRMFKDLFYLRKYYKI